MKRGEVWWARLELPIGARPVVLLSRDESYRIRDAVIVAPVTTTLWNIPVEVPLGPADGLSKPCVVNVDTLLTVEKTQLTRFMSALSLEKIQAINDAIKFALALP